MTDSPETGTIPASPAPEAPDAELVEFLGGEVESKAPPSEPTAPAHAEQPAVTEGVQQRDSQGRFTTAEADAAPDASAGEAPPPPSEPAPPKPFSYRAYGAEHTPFVGATEAVDGALQFPPDAALRLRQALAEGHSAESRRRTAFSEREQKVTSARGANAQLVEQANLTLQRLAELRKTPGALEQFFQDTDRNWQILEAEVRADTLQKQLETRQQDHDARALEQQAETLRPYLRQTLEQKVGQMIANEAELKGLNPADMSERLWSAFFDRVFLEADQDDPNGRYRRGEILVDYEAMRAELQYEAKRQPKATPAPVAAKPAEQKTPVVPPPVVATKGQGARPAPKVPKFKTTEEADAWFDAGGYADL